MRKLTLRAEVPFTYVALISILLGLAVSPAMAAAPVLLPVVTYDSGGFESGFVTAADLNGDGKPDLVVANTYFSNTVGILLGKGDGTFLPVVNYDSGGGFPTSVAVADLNGDGKVDLIVMNQGPCYACLGDGVLSVLLGNGDGTFQSAVSFDPGGGLGAVGGGPEPGQMALGDVNNDGKLDVVVSSCARSGSSGCGVSNGVVGVLLGNGDGTFQPSVTYDSGGTAAGPVALADVNGDHKLDVLVSNNQCASASACATSLLGVLMGNGDGTFQAAKSYGSGGWSARQIAVGDVNHDGKLDMLVGNCGVKDCFAANGRVGVLLGNGDGTFRLATTYDSGGRIPVSIALADLNGDGKLDVVAANAIDFTVGILQGNGDGTFGLPVTYASGGNLTYSVAVQDVNGDRRPDVLVSSCGPPNGGCGGNINGLVGVLLNNTPFDTTPPLITISATPRLLSPPNGQRVPVTISGKITDLGSGVDASSATYTVKDEYGKIQPHGAVTLQREGKYSFTVSLQASCKVTDLNGRHYTITVRAKDMAGSQAAKAVAVVVPHS